ncbi:superfamily protein with Retrovirus zinc finger-like domain [Klebsormidium nitens]|uniref:Superfamily protein with Retrovirus zinc finger-like domain n=1 Tax=Klebsormidium nitens TaxID=105231 RepID=A0A1Y1IPA8_KLENI|nr:superfamily protein with Retrovirus zinc finger-like domain [Klebsormidium nitens]|eukprot:GAQ92483.1 superfamily protein with Retrovirus zinc finger-like domain [Klebsormidium nitens]
MMPKLKLRPNTENLNENDYFYFLVELTSGQARDCAGELESRMADDLDKWNEARLRAFERELVEYERDKERHDALGATERAAATAPVKAQKPAVLEVYDDPVGHFWAMIKDLFPEKSTAQINEFNNFRMQTNESMSSLTQRMKTLMTVLQGPEGMAAQKLLDAIEPKQFRGEIRRIVWAEDTGDDDLTVDQISKANAAAESQRGGSAKAKSKFYKCGEFGHWASHCAIKRAKRQVPGALKKWCKHHNSSTHDTAECKALQHGAPSAPPLANARAAQAPAAQKNEPRDPAEPTLEELQELWDAHYGRVTGYGACVMSARAATRTGKQQPVSRPTASRQAAPKLHSGPTRHWAPKNERRRGRLADMPLGFLPKDFIRTSSPTRPEPAEPAEAEQRAEPDSAQTAAPEVAALAKQKQKETAPEDAAKSAAQGTTRTRILPQGLQELPSDDPRRQGVIYGPTAPVDTAPALQEADQAPAALGSPPEPAADNIDDPENPRIGAPREAARGVPQ